MYGEMKRGLYNEAKSLIYVMKMFERNKKTNLGKPASKIGIVTCNPNLHLQVQVPQAHSRIAEADLTQNSVQRHRHAQSKSRRWVKGGITLQKIFYYMRLSSPS